MLTLLRTNRHFSIFLATQATSNLGDASRNLIVPLLLLQLTHSPALLAALLLMQTVTGLVLRLPFGALLDRWDRRRAMLLADLGRGVLTLLIPLAAALHGPVLLVLFATAVPLSVLATFFGAGFGAITPSLVGKDRVAQAYGLIEGGESLAWIGGPIIAGLLMTLFGAANALIVDGISFLCRPEAWPSFVSSGRSQRNSRAPSEGRCRTTWRGSVSSSVIPLCAGL